ncbi:MAG: serine/threonine protein kinase [Chloracidobacterium sp.]|nr:serine/threonine protein kinase [Chloracidobacterium sp.]MDW8218233.1 serine/threonine-protein kinase [Acidobacteriota bacterium]
MKTCPQCGRMWTDAMRYCPMDGAELPAARTASATVIAKHVTREESQPVQDAPPSPAANADPLIGQVLEGKYQIQSKIGQGATGAIYRAERINIGDCVAVKVLKPEFAEDYTAAERFRREALALGRIRHPNVIAIYDYFERPGQDNRPASIFLVMELLSGKTLRDVLRQEQVLDIRRAVRLMVQVCSALHVAHERNVIHRDLKPENIMIEQYDRRQEMVKVIDFGLARLRLTGKLIKTLTERGRVAGTPYYMAPEQWMDRPLDARTDVYALGIICYEMLTGRVPFNAENVMQLASKHVKTPPQPPIELRRDLPRGLSQAVLKALAKHPQERPATALEFADELQRGLLS